MSPKKRAKKAKTERPVEDKLAAKTYPEPQAEPRAVEVSFRGRVYPGVARGSEFVGLLCKLPRGAGHPDWRKAVKDAVAS